MCPELKRPGRIIKDFYYPLGAGISFLTEVLLVGRRCEEVEREGMNLMSQKKILRASKEGFDWRMVPEQDWSLKSHLRQNFSAS